MSTGNNATAIRVPSRHNPEKGSRETRPRKIQEWIEALPLANLGETSRQVLTALLEINSLNITHQDRYRIMELFRPTVKYISDSLRKHYVGQPFPLSERSRKVAELSRTIAAEMATGYRIILAEAGPAVRIPVRTLATATHRALRYMGSILVNTYQIYDQYPEEAWRDIHQLYRYAEVSGFLTTLVPDHEYTLIDEASSADAYKQILLLALASPYRLRQGEVEQVYGALERWAPHAQICALADPCAAQALFMVVTNGDAPPTYRLPEGHAMESEARLIDTQGLANAIREDMIHGQAPGRGRTTVSPDIMRRLLLAWGMVPKRKFSRARKFSTVMVAMGLSSVHHFISAQTATRCGSSEDLTGSADTPQAQFPPLSTPAEFQSAAPAADAGKMPDVWDLIRPIPFGDKSASGPVHASEAKASFRCQPWKMANVSAGGYHLLWDNGSITNAQVGEIVCVQETDEHNLHGWSVGVVRWMKSVGREGLELGVQILAPNALSAAIALLEGEGRRGEYQRALLLPEVTAIQQPVTLIVPSLALHVGAVLALNHRGKETRVRVTKIFENMGTCAQLQFSDFEPDAKSVPESERTAAAFDAIWNTI